MESVVDNDGRIVHFGVSCKEWLKHFEVYVWHSEGWTARNEALSEAVIS